MEQKGRIETKPAESEVDKLKAGSDSQVILSKVVAVNDREDHHNSLLEAANGDEDTRDHDDDNPLVPAEFDDGEDHKKSLLKATNGDEDTHDDDDNPLSPQKPRTQIHPMAGMLPGVETARRRRLHGWCDSSSSIGSSFGSMRSRLSHDTHLTHTSSILERNHQSDEDDNLGGAAKEAKERLNGRLRGHIKSAIRRVLPELAKSEDHHKNPLEATNGDEDTPDAHDNPLVRAEYFNDREDLHNNGDEHTRDDADNALVPSEFDDGKDHHKSVRKATNGDEDDFLKHVQGLIKMGKLTEERFQELKEQGKLTKEVYKLIIEKFESLDVGGKGRLTFREVSSS